MCKKGLLHFPCGCMVLAAVFFGYLVSFLDLPVPYGKTPKKVKNLQLGTLRVTPSKLVTP